ncbi:NAD(P)-dependent oxidoreductase [Roseomonas sp. CCTCC AB2023176]|uniref:NAD(P)-dependent oxidoreductase n=1 Tax=Roseomonas sp. CCTCC AB2023176 TaxID=3342640 RepID=UPI0035E243E7
MGGDAGRGGGGADAVLLCLPDAPDVAEVLFGAGGALAAMRPGRVAIDFSTIAATSARDHAARAAAAGVALLDAPVSGGPQGAKDATLTIFVGGDGDALEQVRPLLDAVGKTVTHFGPAGSGQVAKSCNQIITSATIAAVAEALNLAARAGLDGEALRTALLGGSARCAALENHAKRMLARGFLPAGFRAELMRKDLRAAEATADAAGAAHPSATRLREALDELVRSGRGTLDTTALLLLLEEA